MRLRYTQESCKRIFRDRRSLDQLVEDLKGVQSVDEAFCTSEFLFFFLIVCLLSGRSVRFLGPAGVRGETLCSWLSLMLIEQKTVTNAS
ncbi:hypothetical protein EBZ37_11085 [bacterium]|nr:hypothetical protein [bacterium]